MITVDTKINSTSSSPLSLSVPTEEPKVSFSDLLKGMNSKKDAKVLQNGTVVLALQDEKADVKPLKETVKAGSKNDLMALLKGVSESTLNSQENLPTLEITPQEIKSFIVKAKSYLKSQILQSDGYKKSQVQELPKTLKGLATLAKKFDIDVSKITLQKVQETDTKSKSKVLQQPLLKHSKIATIKSKNEERVKPLEAMLHKTKSTPKVDTASVVKPRVKEIKVDTTKVLKSEVKETKEDTAKVLKSEVKDTKVERVSVVEPELKKTKTDTKSVVRPEVKETKVDTISTLKPELKAEETFSTSRTPFIQKESSLETLLHKPISIKKHQDQKSSKVKADETLQMLLKGDKQLHTTNSTMTSDFSVATAKVIAPTAPTQSVHNLESLLHGEKSLKDETQEVKEVKVESVSTLKSDSLELKMNEAKQLTKYLSSDVKNAIDEYKSPFTRVKVQLNPQKLGEVDLTIVQRGKNLHVNIGSNNIAIHTLALNANDLKTQLSNNGINNATLNFTNTSQDGSSGSFSQQQHRQQEQHQASQEYNYYDKEVENEEVLDSLEIIVHNYA